MSQEGTCAGGWPGRRWVSPHRGTQEPEAGVQVAPLAAGALQPLTKCGHLPLGTR